MNFARFQVAVLLVLGLTLPGHAGVLVVNSFDTDRQGWSPGFPAATGTGNFWLSSGGNPGGYVRSFDRSNSLASGFEPWFFENGSDIIEIAGDYSAAYGGNVSYDLFSSGNGPLRNTATSLDNFDLALLGNIGPTSYFLLFDHAANPNSNWSNFSAPLVETAGWLVTTNPGSNPATWTTPTETLFRGVLENLQGARVRGDYYEVDETTGLDNFQISEASAVPEPSSLALTGLGACGVMLYKARRSRRTRVLDV